MAAITKFVFKYLPSRNVNNISLIRRKIWTGFPTEFQGIARVGLSSNGSTVLCVNNIHTSITDNSFFTHLPADHLWKSTISVSNAGRKKGRGKGIGKKFVKNLNRGQVIGLGKVNMLWPGLNTSILTGKDITYQKELPPNEERMNRILALRNQMSDFNPLLLDALERGFKSTSWPGRSLGPPVPTRDGRFDDFDTKVLEVRYRGYMTANFGRKRQVTVLVATGNKKGLAGFFSCKGFDINTVMKKAKHKAAHNLIFHERYEDHTVMHDFQSKECKLELFVEKQPKGYGLNCNRYVRTICDLIGIKDLKCTLEGKTRPLNIVKAFFNGLRNQKTPQQLADLMRLNLVEFRPECDNYPRLIAAPTNGCRKRHEILENEITDYTEVINEGKLFDVNIQKPMIKKNFKREKNQHALEYRLRARTGEKKSFYHLSEERRVEEKLRAEVIAE